MSKARNVPPCRAARRNYARLVVRKMRDAGQISRAETRSTFANAWADGLRVAAPPRKERKGYEPASIYAFLANQTIPLAKGLVPKGARCIVLGERPDGGGYSLSYLHPTKGFRSMARVDIDPIGAAA